MRIHESRLSNATLARLAPSIARPLYDRSAVTIGIVHLGIGAFHRAHQAVYTDSVLNEGSGEWGILGASLRGTDTRDALTPQDGLYTLMVRDGTGQQMRIVGSVMSCLVAPQEPKALLAAMTRPKTRIVSLTVTEKGYCHRPATGDLDETHPDVRHDLAHPGQPRTAIGFIVEALRQRRAAGLAPFTPLTCDNLPANGRVLKAVLTRFAALRDPDLGRYIEAEVSCPSTMVDRIVPATTDKDRASAEAATGLHDAWPIATEPFTQWMIEDRFTMGRPAWERFGAMLVDDVAPFELMKIRLLNGSHSTLAYLGYLAGHETVSDAMAAPGFSSLITAMMDDEISPALPLLPSFDLKAYKTSLLHRFNNPALHHRTWQIAMDGSQKLPQRLLNTIRDATRTGRSYPRLALGVAAWMRYAMGTDEKGNPIDVRDPLAGRIADMTRGLTSVADIVSAYLGLADVFGPDLPQDAGFRASLETHMTHLLEKGAAQTVGLAADWTPPAEGLRSGQLNASNDD